MLGAGSLMAVSTELATRFTQENQRLPNIYLTVCLQAGRPNVRETYSREIYFEKETLGGPTLKGNVIDRATP